MGVSGQHHAPAALYPRGKDPRYPLDTRLSGPRVGLDAGATRKILCLCRGSNPDRPAHCQSLYCLSYAALLEQYVVGTLKKVASQFIINTRPSIVQYITY
jgi:hypothetical protein